MKHLYALGLLLLSSSAIADPAAPPPKTYQVTFTQAQMQVVAEGLYLASRQCGAGNEDACRVGLSAQTIMQAMNAAIAAEKK
jgi:hypothetical protein